MKFLYVAFSLISFNLCSSALGPLDFEDSSTIACELFLDCGSDQTNEQKYLECFKEFIKIFPFDEYDNPQQFLADALQFIKTIIENNRYESYDGILRIGDSFEFDTARGIHVGILLQAGQDQKEKRRWNIMVQGLINLMRKYTDEDDIIQFVDGLITVIPSVISPESNEQQFQEDILGNRFKFNFDLC